MIVIVIFLASLFILYMLGIPLEIAGLLVLILMVGVISYFIIEGNIEDKEKEEIKNTAEYKNYVKQYQNLLKKYKNSEYYLKDDDDYDSYYAIFDNQIHIISELYEADFIDIVTKKLDDLKEHVYDMDDVRYYKLEGSVQQQQHISGGGGGGSSIKGAIIGSRKKVNEIQTTYVEDDDRRVVVVLKDDDEFNMPFKFYDRLLDYAPEKDYDNYIAAKKAKGRRKGNE